MNSSAYNNKYKETRQQEEEKKQVGKIEKQRGKSCNTMLWLTRLRLAILNWLELNWIHPLCVYVYVVTPILLC